jgi:hypothetical protein
MEKIQQFKDRKPVLCDIPLPTHTDEPSSFGSRLADRVAAVLGSWPFLIVQSTLLSLWIVWNALPLGQFFSVRPALLSQAGSATRPTNSRPLLRVFPAALGRCRNIGSDLVGERARVPSVSFSGRHSALDAGVLDIVLLSSDEEVLRIDTGAIVAPVQNKRARRYWAVIMGPKDAVRSLQLVLEINKTITIVGFGSCPFPAARGRHQDAK